MYDAGKIIPGIIIFLLLVTAPIWYNVATGKAEYKPQLEKAVGATQCVESTEYMRTNHMNLLDAWRDDVVRGGERKHRAPNGQIFEKSLTNTCLDCHKKKSKFCDTCHEYVGVVNYCWDCHLNPEDLH